MCCLLCYAALRYRARGGENVTKAPSLCVKPSAEGASSHCLNCMLCGPLFIQMCSSGQLTLCGRQLAQLVQGGCSLGGVRSHHVAAQLLRRHYSCGTICLTGCYTRRTGWRHQNRGAPPQRRSRLCHRLLPRQGAGLRLVRRRLRRRVVFVACGGPSFFARVCSGMPPKSW